MLKIPWPRKRAEGGEIKTLTVHSDRDLWWVRIILNVGRPVVAVFVLIMCAPGEHYLARLAGWSDWLAWGMPATLTAYAGIAAVVATKRPKGAPGKITAVAGAIVSVLLAMGAQPIAHLYQQQLITGHLFALTIVVSCIPALVFGHLLHMAAVPNEVRPEIRPGARTVPPGVLTFDDRDIPFLAGGNHDLQTGTDDEDSEPGEDAFMYRAGDEDTGIDAGLDYLRGTPLDVSGVPDNVNEDLRGPWDAGQLQRDALDAINRPAPTYSGEDLHDVLRQVDVSPEGTTWRGHRADLVFVDDVPPADILRDSRADNRADIDQGQTPVSRPVPGTPDTDTGDTGTGTQSPGSVPSRGTSRPGVTSRVRDILRDNPGTPEDKIRDTFAGEDIPRNTINKSIKRVKTEMGIN